MWNILKLIYLYLPAGDRDQTRHSTTGKGREHFGIVGQWPVATANFSAKFFYFFSTSAVHF